MNIKRGTIVRSNRHVMFQAGHQVRLHRVKRKVRITSSRGNSKYGTDVGDEISPIDTDSVLPLGKDRAGSFYGRCIPSGTKENAWCPYLILETSSFSIVSYLRGGFDHELTMKSNVSSITESQSSPAAILASTT